MDKYAMVFLLSETREDDLEKILKVILENNEEMLESVIVQLWIGFFGPRDIYRELKLQYLDENTAVFAVHSMRLDVSGLDFLKHLVALEIEEKMFIDKKIISEIDMRRFLESINEGKYPRVIMDETFRSRYNLPQTLPEYEIRVTGIALVE